MFSLAWPWLLVVLPLPWLVLKWVKPANVAPTALKVPFYQQAVGEQQRSKRTVQRQRLYYLSALWCCVVFAAANPRWLGQAQPVTQSTRDIMLAVDISGSMEVEDMRLGGQMVNRLQGIKAVMDSFIERRKGDRLGLILFADNAYVQAPLTLDHQVLNRFLQEAQIGFAGKNTAIGEAIGLAVKKMQENPAQRKVLILLTDGANSAGVVSPIEAAKIAARQGLKIYTLGFGADEMIVQDFFSQRKINPSQDLDEDTLQEIARLTSGQYFRARNLDQLVDIYRLLDQLEPNEIGDQIIIPQRSLFHWPLGVAFMLSLLWAFTHCWQGRRSMSLTSRDQRNVR